MKLFNFFKVLFNQNGFTWFASMCRVTEVDTVLPFQPFFIFLVRQTTLYLPLPTSTKFNQASCFFWGSDINRKGCMRTRTSPVYQVIFLASFKISKMGTCLKANQDCFCRAVSNKECKQHWLEMLLSSPLTNSPKDWLKQTIFQIIFLKKKPKINSKPYKDFFKSPQN